MFRVNDTVMYGNLGVCRIADVCPQTFDQGEKLYYILKPVYDENSTIYCPVDSDKIRIRKLLSAKEIHELIQIMPDMETEWIENDLARKERFTEILKSGDHQQLITLIKALYFNRQEKSRTGKKFHLSDEKIMHEAENILYGEFAHVLNIQQEEVLPFIMGELEDVVEKTS